MSKNEIKEKIKKSRQLGNLKSKIFTTGLNVLGYSNRYIGAVESREKAYRYIKKNYSGFIDDYLPDQDISKEKKEILERPIWVCWWQGEENAPIIVRRCIDSLRQFESQRSIQVITKENYSQYITFPDYIVRKWESGIISNTHMSDLLRLELLIRYGGLWVDATVFLTDKIPEYIFEKNLFLFKVMSRENCRVEYNSWFIFAKKNNLLLKTTRHLLYKFWEKEKKTREYFLWHLMLTAVIEKHPEYVDEIYYIPDEIEHILGRCWFKQFDIKYWNVLTSLTSIHKLTTKDIEPKETAGTYYEKILSGDL